MSTSTHTAVPRPAFQGVPPSRAGAPGAPQAGLRAVLGGYASGVTVVTGFDEHGPAGFTCQSFHSVSLDPPLISINVARSSSTYPRIRRTGSFAVNVLSGAQQAVSDQFARSGADRWTGISWSPTENGNPALSDSLVWLDCDIWAEHEAGDHLIVLGQVRQTSPPPAQGLDPLLFYRGRYDRLDPTARP